ncbi:DUF2798 domain-containing protein [Tropicimonas sp. S265A]|uniref:DUF2798 domain-containing protein n=1 Tax=Tropicimonas sp. S265A TaxID=3415134 RepID=UPI003C7C33F7
MIPARFAPSLFALILSGVMSCVVSGVVSLKALGPVDGFLGIWIEAWLFAWAVAFPSALLVAPVARKLVARLTISPEKP